MQFFENGKPIKAISSFFLFSFQKKFFLISLQYFFLSSKLNTDIIF